MFRSFGTVELQFAHPRFTLECGVVLRLPSSLVPDGETQLPWPAIVECLAEAHRVARDQAFIAGSEQG